MNDKAKRRRTARRFGRWVGTASCAAPVGGAHDGGNQGGGVPFGNDKKDWNRRAQTPIGQGPGLEKDHDPGHRGKQRRRQVQASAMDA
jgi:hypothetical protein